MMVQVGNQPLPCRAIKEGKGKIRGAKKVCRKLNEFLLVEWSPNLNSCFSNKEGALRTRLGVSNMLREQAQASGGGVALHSTRAAVLMLIHGVDQSLRSRFESKQSAAQFQVQKKGVRGLHTCTKGRRKSGDWWEGLIPKVGCEL